jgi:hypothetical protein
MRFNSQRNSSYPLGSVLAHIPSASRSRLANCMFSQRASLVNGPGALITSLRRSRSTCVTQLAGGRDFPFASSLRRLNVNHGSFKSMPIQKLPFSYVGVLSKDVSGISSHLSQSVVPKVVRVGTPERRRTLAHRSTCWGTNVPTAVIRCNANDGSWANSGPIDALQCAAPYRSVTGRLRHDHRVTRALIFQQAALNQTSSWCTYGSNAARTLSMVRARVGSSASCRARLSGPSRVK